MAYMAYLAYFVYLAYLAYVMFMFNLPIERYTNARIYSPFSNQISSSLFSFLQSNFAFCASVKR